MKIFISYARVDKPYCVQIINTLEVHSVWYDQRLRAGQHWWKEILRRLDWCDGFIYLLSPDSLASEYCQKEYKIARDLGRHIFPVLIHPDTDIPEELSKTQFVDFRKGLTIDAVKSLLNSIYLVEQQSHSQNSDHDLSVGSSDIVPPGTEILNPIGLAAIAMEEGAYDRAVFLLKHAKAHDRISKYIKVDVLLEEAEKSLEQQTKQRQASREYRQIADVVNIALTRELGCEAFHAFRLEFPDYDPEGLATKCPQKEQDDAPADSIKQDNSRIDFMPMLEWCTIPAGQIEISVPHTDPDTFEIKTLEVPEYRISKYPITNAQYDVFQEDPDGYYNVEWWNFSAESLRWFKQNSNPIESTFKGDERPTEMVNWFSSMAFCNWLSHRTGLRIVLPTDAQWVRAAEGESKRDYPWGDEFSSQCCNTQESGYNMTTMVTRYKDSISPFGVADMSGNVWEWCLDATGEGRHLKHLVHGGSYMSTHERAKIRFRYYIDPKNYHSSIGFRIVCLTPEPKPNGKKS